MSTQSLWQATAQAPTFPSLTQSASADVVVVGGGITGLTTAYLLSRAGRSVIVVDLGRIGGVVTSRTTAHLTTLLDARYHSLIDDFGPDAAQLAARSSIAAIDQIEANARAEQIDCQFERLPAYLYTETNYDDDVLLLQEEIAAAQQVGLPADWDASVPLSFVHAPALRCDDQAQFHPLRYVYGLAHAIIANGGAIYEHTRVVDVDDGEPCSVTTDHGSITAQHVVIATHLPLNDKYLFTKAAPYRSYVIGVRLGSGAVPHGLFYDTADPYHYIRAASDERGSVLIIGGEDHKTGQDDDEQRHFDALEQYARQRFDVAEVAYRWSAQVYEPADGLAYIGKRPFCDQIYEASGYSGTGMTFGTLAAMIMSDAILERPNPYSDLYSIGRLKLKAGLPDLVREGLNVAKHFVADRFSTDADAVGEIGMGEGALIEVDGKQRAVYRADDGTLHTMSPTCTHLGCVVQWNTAERTWDCPCHGGRYSPTGAVIEGPPTRNLKTLDD